MSNVLQSIKAKNAGIKLHNKRAIVVGGTSGIGEGIARRLAKANVSVTIIGRSQERGSKILSDLHQLGGKDHSFVSCDCLSVKNAADCSKALSEQYSNIDYLVLSQGISTMDGRVETKEKLEQKLAIHYFSRVAFIEGLLPSLRKSEDGGKVLSVFSGGVHGPYKLYKEDFELKKHFSLKNCADASGMYNDIAMDCFSRGMSTTTIKNISSTENNSSKTVFIHAAPGVVNTRWGHDMPFYASWPIKMMQKYFAMSIDDCGEIMCAPLFDINAIKGVKATAPNNFHVMSAKAEQDKVTALHEEARDFVWQETWRVMQDILGKK